jgi:hypothetical protein
MAKQQDWKKGFWKYATAAVVVLIVLSPELAHLGLVIDAIGLETMLLLLEIQILVLAGSWANRMILPAMYRLRQIGRHCVGLCARSSKAGQPGALLLALPSAATCMQILVIVTAAGMIGGLH